MTLFHLPYSRSRQESPSATAQLGLLRLVAGAVATLWRAGATKPAVRPLAKMMSRRIAVGPSFPLPPAKKQAKFEHECDCVPLDWM